MKNYPKILYSLFSDKVNRYSLFHGQSSGVVDNETRLWRCYQWLQHEYGPFLRTLPDYELAPGAHAPKIIWWCWLQGEEQAPELCKACLASVRKQLPDFTVHVVTEDNLSQYITVPEIFKEKRKAGIISGAHYSDIIRTLLLLEHGGTWMDATVFCSSYQSPVLEQPFFVFQNWKFNDPYASICSNWLISSAPSHPILKTVLALLGKYWEENDTALDYFIYHLLFHLAADKYAALWSAVPRYSNIPPHLMQYELFKPFDPVRYKEICRMSDFHKLNWKAPELKENTPGTLYAHIIQQTNKI